VLIRRVETFALKLPADVAYLGPLPDASVPPNRGYHVRPPWRSLYSSRYETTLVRLECDDGTAGWGEALAPVGPEIARNVIDLLLAPQLVGQPAAAPRPVSVALRELMRERGHLLGHQADALAAVDMALWDLAARLLHRPLVDALGGRFRDAVPTYVSGLPRPDDAGRADLASEWAQRGASGVKLHLGHGVETDLDTVRAVQEAAPGLRIAVDAHWAYSVTDALRLAAGLERLGGWFLEAPLAPEDIDGHGELVRRTTVPIAVGETLRNRYEFAQWLDARALRIAQPDVARTGVTELMAIAELCAARHVPVAPHHSVGLGVSLAAGVSVGAAVEHLAAFEYQPTSVEVGAAILTAPLPVRADRIPVPRGDGLGVDVDLDAVARLAKES
jgi:galactonate dehydratase